MCLYNTTTIEEVVSINNLQSAHLQGLCSNLLGDVPLYRNGRMSAREMKQLIIQELLNQTQHIPPNEATLHSICRYLDLTDAETTGVMLVPE